MEDGHERTKTKLKRVLPIAVILAVAIVGGVTLRDYLSFETLRDNRAALIVWRDSNYGLAVLGFMAAYIVIVAFSLPGAAIASLTGGFLFGVASGSAINLLAATTGATLIFAAAKYGLGDRLASRIDASDGAVSKFKQGLKENEISYLFFMRLVPAVPFFVANLVPALVGVSLGRFVFTTFFGIIPGAIVYTWVGSGLGEVFARGDTPNLGIIFEWQILLPILGLSALALLPVALKKFRQQGT